MKTFDDMWTIFLDMHKDMSIQDLQDIKNLYQLGYNMGELTGLERGRQILEENNKTTFNIMEHFFEGGKI